MGEYLNWGGWTAKQRNMLRREIKAGSTIAYWCSDAHGRSANGGQLIEPAKPGVVHRQAAPGRVEACGPGAVHATYEPHRWAGCRVWIVAMRGDVVREEHKLAAAERLIIGEVLPEWAPDPWCGVRVGRKDLGGADLGGADLYGANLRGANLRGANLRGANLRGANLYGDWERGPDGYARKKGDGE